ncbi:geranylgeranylglyceryl/heptaprenylglyceryl phosphate synthase [Sanyastnella coralliicola]|uniref:geranylgeranylglyceryl/heptaprenylglyceryl phosphate synthase n=1 Tax=Sanyastnella coralliicola TaxID=3069118 RepID=UPI0027B97915|nr:geranylgeranylglyceryl/heptaprenylglyceryl phosphate synthase [Longitalea sp. SCSIO 12813]
MSVLQQIRSFRSSGEKGIAYLLDPDKLQAGEVDQVFNQFDHFPPDLIFVGGSLITEQGFEDKMKAVREATNLPLVLFPGSPAQLTPHVDALLFLSLVSGRNPELLIGHHVTAAPVIKDLGIECLSTGYMLVDGGRPTTASYISNTQPIPRNKPGIAAATAMASELLGHQLIFLDAGSGADAPVPTEMIRAVRQSVDLPIIVGGGIRRREQLDAAFMAGADLAVLGTVIENEPELLAELRQ